MDAAKSDDHFERIALHHEIEKHRGIVADYENSMAFYRQKIENAQYRLGELDERLRR